MIHQNKWIEIRKRLYLQIKTEVRERLGEDSRELSQYRAAYQSTFKKRFKSSNKNELIAAVRKAQVVFLADFHALKQSQKAQLRVLRELGTESSGIVLGVEFIDAAYQRELDLYMSGKVKDVEFLKKIHWNSNWGFDWEHYKPLLDWAMKHNVYVRALNKSFPERSHKSLRARDEFSGELIADLVSDYPAHKIVVIYGDLHLAPEHLPQVIERRVGCSLKMCFVFQNSEDLYFKMLRQKRDADVLKLSANVFCLMSVTPWVKWQNYLLFLERSSDSFFDDDDGIDYTDHVAQNIRFISAELDLGIGLDELVVYSARDEKFWEKIGESCTQKEQKQIKLWVREERSFYLANLQIAYLARPTVNHAVSLGMRYVLAQSQVQIVNSSKYGFFLKQIFEEAWVYFGTKIVNPKRKTDTIADLQYSLGARNITEKGSAILKCCLSQRMYEILFLQGISKRSPSLPRSEEVLSEAAVKMGGILGEKIYTAYSENIIKSADVEFYLKSAFDLELYMSLVRTLEGVHLTFASKRDKL